MSGACPARTIRVSSFSSVSRPGHAILVDVRDFAGVRLGPGTLYGAIGRLEADGLIEPMELDGRRRPYRLTSAGRAALADRLDGLNVAIQTGLRRMEARA